MPQWRLDLSTVDPTKRSPEARISDGRNSDETFQSRLQKRKVTRSKSQHRTCLPSEHTCEVMRIFGRGREGSQPPRRNSGQTLEVKGGTLEVKAGDLVRESADDGHVKRLGHGIHVSVSPKSFPMQRSVCTSRVSGNEHCVSCATSHLVYLLQTLLSCHR